MIPVDIIIGKNKSEYVLKKILNNFADVDLYNAFLNIPCSSDNLLFSIAVTIIKKIALKRGKRRRSRIITNKR